MSNTNTKRSFPKNSRETTSPKLLQALSKMFANDGGTVSYIFIEERLQKTPFVNEQTGLLDYTMTPIQKKSTLYRKIGTQALKGEKPGSLKSLAELYDMFNTTKNDLGASYFIVD